MTRQGPARRVVGTQPNAATNSPPELAFHFFLLHFCSANVQCVTGVLVNPLSRGAELLLSVCLSVGLCVIFFLVLCLLTHRCLSRASSCYTNSWRGHRGWAPVKGSGCLVNEEI